MKRTINLNNLIGIPPEYINRLNACKSIFIDNDFMDSVKESHEVSCLIEEIDDYCSNHLITGFHYAAYKPQTHKLKVYRKYSKHIDEKLN